MSGGKARVLAVLVAAAALLAVVLVVRLRAKGPTASLRAGAAPTSAASSVPSDVGVGGIAGLVRDATGTPRGSVLIAIRGPVRRSIETDPRGGFEVDDLTTGTYHVSASASDGAVTDVSCDVIANGRTNVVLRLSAVKGAVALTGTVLDILGGTVPGAEVWVGAEAGPTVVARTGPSGAFATRVAPGNYEVRVRAPGYAEAADQITVASDLALELVIHPASTIRGVVFRGENAAAPGARVRAAKWRGDVFEAVTDGEGHFTLADLPPGTYAVEANTDAETGRATANLGPASTRDVRIVLQTGATVAGSVRAADGTPIGQAEIKLAITDAMPREAKSAADGTYRVVPVVSGPVSASACAAGYQCVGSEERVVATGSTLNLDLTMRPAGKVRVRVSDKDGVPVLDAQAFLGDFTNCRTASNGECIIDHAAPRKTTLSVSHATLGYSEEKSITIGDKEAAYEVRLLPGATLRGTVRWDDGKPAAGVHVFSDDLVTRTGSDGRYELANVKPGFLDVRATASIAVGQRSLAQRFGMDRDIDFSRVSAGEVRERVDLVLRRKSKSIAGTVTGSDGSPVSYARVGMSRDDPKRSWTAEHAGEGPLSIPSTYSAADGAFVIDGVEEGKYVLWADAEQQPIGRTRDVAAGSEHVVVKLPAAATIEGDVKDERGAIMTTFVVRYGGFAGSARRVTSDAGHFVLRGLPSGPQSIVVEGFRTSGAGATTTSLLGGADVEVATGESKVVSIVVRPSLAVSGRVVAWPDLTPRGGIELNTHGNPMRSAVTSADGRFRVTGVMPGAIEFWTFDADGKKEEWQRVVPDGPSEVDIGDLAFFPSTQYGNGFSFSVDGKRVLVAHTDDQGRSHELGLAEGDELVSIGGHAVAPLSGRSLDIVIDGLTPEVPVVVRKHGQGPDTTLRLPPKHAGSRPVP